MLTVHKHTIIQLQLYSIYTSGFEDAIKTLTEWTKKEKRFDALVKNFEVRSNLGLVLQILRGV